MARLCAAFIELKIGSLNIKTLKPTFFHHHGVAFRVPHEPIGPAYLPAVYILRFSLEEGTIAALGRLDVVVVATVFCLWADRLEKVGCYRQNLFNETISMYLPVASIQLSQEIGANVED